MISKLIITTLLIVNSIAIKIETNPDEGTYLDKNFPTSNFGYTINEFNNVQTETQQNDDQSSQGNYYIKLPKGKTHSNVQFIADDLGFQSGFRIATQDDHSQVTSHFALGTSAIKALGEPKNNFQQNYQLQQLPQFYPTPIPYILTRTTPTLPIEENFTNKPDENLNENQRKSERNLIETKSLNNSSFNENIQNLIRNYDFSEINDSIEKSTEPIVDFSKNDRENQFHQPIIVDERRPLISSPKFTTTSRRLNFPYTKFPLNEVKIFPTNENFLNQYRSNKNGKQINVHIISDEEENSKENLKENEEINIIEDESKESDEADNKDKIEAEPRIAYQSSEEDINHLSTTKIPLIISTENPSSSAVNSVVQEAKESEDDEFINNTTPSEEKTLVEVQKSYNIQNVFIKQNSNGYLEQHEEYYPFPTEFQHQPTTFEQTPVRNSYDSRNIQNSYSISPYEEHSYERAPFISDTQNTLDNSLNKDLASETQSHEKIIEKPIPLNEYLDVDYSTRHTTNPAAKNQQVTIAQSIPIQSHPILIPIYNTDSSHLVDHHHSSSKPFHLKERFTINQPKKPLIHPSSIPPNPLPIHLSFPVQMLYQIENLRFPQQQIRSHQPAIFYRSSSNDHHHHNHHQQLKDFKNPFKFEIPPKRETLKVPPNLLQKSLPTKGIYDLTKRYAQNYKIDLKDDYFGPVPMKNDLSHWGNSILQKSRRNLNFGRNLRMEYGFKPPLVPSIEIDDQGLPVKRSESEDQKK